MKIPPFWPVDPLVWFAQVEVQFATRNITRQRTRFDHVVTVLSTEFATEVRDIIFSPSEVDVYSKLKDFLIKRTAASERKRLQRLFTPEELGSWKPTQLLQQMQLRTPGRLCWLPTGQLSPPGTIFPTASQPCLHGAGFLWGQFP